jgi:hypothetical protein
MSKYRKKPVVIEAEQFIDSTPKTLLKIYDFTGEMDNGVDLLTNEIVIHTLEGDMKASLGDYIIKGIQGEFYPCKPDIFKETYEEVKDE